MYSLESDGTLSFLQCIAFHPNFNGARWSMDEQTGIIYYQKQTKNKEEVHLYSMGEIRYNMVDILLMGRVGEQIGILGHPDAQLKAIHRSIFYGHVPYLQFFV